ncbi:hypothetical protein ACFCP7_12865 [Paenibacillus elgii]
MIKMYKSINDLLHYWEVWYDSKKFHIHFGIVGDTGVHQTHAKKTGTNIKKFMEELAIEKSREGYQFLEEKELTGVMIQYKIDKGNNVEEDLKKRGRVESLMNECLGWTGNGHCDGGDYGSGTMNIFCFVVDVEIAIKTIVKELEKNNLLISCTVAYLNSEEDYISVYPKEGDIVGIF